MIFTWPGRYSLSSFRFCPGSESPEFTHSTRSNFIDDLEYRNINNVSHFRRDSRVRSEGQVTLLGLTKKAVGVEGEQARPGWTTSRPEGSVLLSAKDPGPELRRYSGSGQHTIPPTARRRYRVITAHTSMGGTWLAWLIVSRHTHNPRPLPGPTRIPLADREL